jgi:hypothetical protein
MAINIVPVNTGGSGVAPQQSVMRTPQVRPQFHPGPNPWAGITKAIDKSLPVISKIVKNKDTIEALQKAMGPKPDGSSKLTDMAYRIMEAGKATNDSSLFAQGVSMLQKQEGREYGKGQYEEKRDESREFGTGQYEGRRDETRKFGSEQYGNRRDESRKYNEAQKKLNRDEQRIYSEKLRKDNLDEGRTYSEKIRKENREYGEDLYGSRTESQRDYAEDQYRTKTKDRRDYADSNYKTHRTENRTYNEALYEARLESRTKANAAILKEKREYAWTKFEEKTGLKVTAAQKLRMTKRDEKKIVDDAKRDEKRSYTEAQSEIKFKRSHPHDFGPGIGRLTPPQAYSMWKDANDLASEVDLEILKNMDIRAYVEEKNKIAKAEGDFPKWTQKKIGEGKERAKPVSKITDTSKIPDYRNDPGAFDKEYYPNGKK